MPKTVYTFEQKIKAIQLLISNVGDVEKTSKQTKIPDRTLALWKAQVQESTNMTSLIFGVHDPETHARYERYEKIRNKLITIVDDYFLKLEKQPDDHAVNSLALARLLDRLTKIEDVLKAMGQANVCVLFELPNQLKVMPWQRTINEDEQLVP